jgi:hypothetical protein
MCKHCKPTNAQPAAEAGEPEFRYFESSHSGYVWKMPATGLGQVRFGPNQPWEESMYTLKEVSSIPGHPEILNPDQEPISIH